jgi:hypothetical protein
MKNLSMDDPMIIASDLDKYEAVFDIVLVEKRHFNMRWMFEQRKEKQKCPRKMLP